MQDPGADANSSSLSSSWPSPKDHPCHNYGLYFKSLYSVPASFVTTPCQGHQAIKQVQGVSSKNFRAAGIPLAVPPYSKSSWQAGQTWQTPHKRPRSSTRPRSSSPSPTWTPCSAPHPGSGPAPLHTRRCVWKSKILQFLFRETIICTLRGMSSTLAPPHYPLVQRRLERKLSFLKVAVFNPPVLFGVSFLTWSMPLGPITSSLWSYP